MEMWHSSAIRITHLIQSLSLAFDDASFQQTFIEWEWEWERER